MKMVRKFILYIVFCCHLLLFAGRLGGSQGQDSTHNDSKMQSDEVRIEDRSAHEKSRGVINEQKDISLAIFLSKCIEQKNIEGIFSVVQKNNIDKFKEDYDETYWSFRPRFCDVFSFLNQYVRDNMTESTDGTIARVLFDQVLGLIHFLDDDFWWKELVNYSDEYEKFIPIFIAFFIRVIAHQKDFDIRDFDLGSLFSAAIFSADHDALEKKSFWKASDVSKNFFISDCKGVFPAWLKGNKQLCFDIIHSVPECIENLSSGNDFRKFLLFEYYLHKNQYNAATDLFLENKDFFGKYINVSSKKRSRFNNDHEQQCYFLPLIEYLSRVDDQRLKQVVDTLFRWFCCAKKRGSSFIFLEYDPVIRCVLDFSDEYCQKVACSVLNHHAGDMKRYCCAVHEEKQERLDKVLTYIKPFVDQYNQTKDKVLVSCCDVLSQFMPKKPDDKSKGVLSDMCLEFIFESLTDRKCKEHYFKLLGKGILYAFMQSERDNNAVHFKQFISFLQESPSLNFRVLFMLYTYQKDRERVNEIVDYMLEEKIRDAFEYIPICFIKAYFQLVSNDERAVKVLQKLPEKVLSDELIVRCLYERDVDQWMFNKKVLLVLASLHEDLFLTWMEKVRLQSKNMYAQVILHYLNHTNADQGWEQCAAYLNKCDDEHQADFLEVFRRFTDIDAPERPMLGLDWWLKVTLDQLIERQLYTIAHTIVLGFDANLSCDFFKTMFLKVKADISIEDMVCVFRTYFIARPEVFVTILLYCKSGVDIDRLCSLCFGSLDVQTMGKNMNWNFLASLQDENWLLGNYSERLHKILWMFHADEYDRMTLALQCGVSLSEKIVTEQDRSIFKLVVRQVFEKKTKEVTEEKRSKTMLLDFMWCVLRTAQLLNCSLSESELPIHNKLIIDNGRSEKSFAEFLVFNIANRNSRMILSELCKAGFVLREIYLPEVAAKNRYYFDALRRYGLFEQKEQILKTWEKIQAVNSKECGDIMGYILNNHIKNFSKFLMRCYEVKGWAEQNFLLLKHCISQIYDQNLFKEDNKKKFKVIYKFLKFLSSNVQRPAVENLFTNSKEEKVHGGTLWGLVAGYWLLHATEKVLFINPYENEDEYSKGRQYILTILGKVNSINFFVKSFNHQTAFANLFSCDHVRHDTEFISNLQEIRFKKIDGWVWKEICLQNQTRSGFSDADTIEDMLKKNDLLKEFFLPDANEKMV